MLSFVWTLDCCILGLVCEGRILLESTAVLYEEITAIFSLDGESAVFSFGDVIRCFEFTFILLSWDTLGEKILEGKKEKSRREKKNEEVINLF